MHANGTEIWQALRHHNKQNMISFHMPGHKRKQNFAPYLDALGAQLDITEIPNFDDLHDPSDLLQDAMENTARLCGSKQAFFLVNGSTAGILSAIRSATKRFDTVLVARNCHRAVYHAIELCCLNTVFLDPPTVDGFGCVASVPPQMVQDALDKHPDISLVILTSPTYEGILSDVASIASIVHEKDIPLFVDEAHGAHLGFHPAFPQSAIQCGADLIVQSFHKTLPSLTQSAVLHLNSHRISSEAIQRQLMIFQSSSPSYLLLASLDACTRLLLAEDAYNLFEAWQDRLYLFAEQMQALSHFTLLSQDKSPHIWWIDPSKIVIATNAQKLSGVDLFKLLDKEYGIQLEMASMPYVVAMTALADTADMMKALARALLSIEQSMRYEHKSMASVKAPSTIAKMPIYEALEKPCKVCEKPLAVGQISASYIWAYPPAIPLIVPGEIISQEMVDYLDTLEKANVNLQSSKGNTGEEFAVLDV